MIGRSARSSRCQWPPAPGDLCRAQNQRRNHPWCGWRPTWVGHDTVQAAGVSRQQADAGGVGGHCSCRRIPSAGRCQWRSRAAPGGRGNVGLRVGAGGSQRADLTSGGCGVPTDAPDVSPALSGCGCHGVAGAAGAGGGPPLFRLTGGEQQISERRRRSDDHQWARGQQAGTITARQSQNADSQRTSRRLTASRLAAAGDGGPQSVRWAPPERRQGRPRQWQSAEHSNKRREGTTSIALTPKHWTPPDRRHSSAPSRRGKPPKRRQAAPQRRSTRCAPPDGQASREPTGHRLAPPSLEADHVAGERH